MESGFRGRFPQSLVNCRVRQNRRDMEPRDYSRLYQVTQRRAKIQDLALQLLHLLDSCRRTEDTGQYNPYDLLVGAVFSLWRAIFLVDAADDWDSVLTNAERFLERVIRHNAITYMDDWNNRKWSFLYYLSDTHFRLHAFAKTIPEFKSADRLCVPTVTQEPLQLWEDHSNAVWDAIDLLARMAEEDKRAENPSAD